MGKPIKITKKHFDEVLKEFKASLSSMKLSDGKINYSRTFNNDDERTAVYFTTEAWVKMVALVHNFSEEVSWNGLVRRNGKDEPQGYIIYDIIVFPQEVTGSAVNTDQEKYQMWLMSLEDDVFNNVRMLGHSHVNMSVNPSSVDTTLQEKILGQLEDDMFYIFMIINKRFESHTVIYDLQKNMLYENGDVDVKLFDSSIQLDAFVANAKEFVTKKSAYSSAITGYTGHSYKDSYHRYRNAALNPDTKMSSATKNKQEKPKTLAGDTKRYQSSYFDYDDLNGDFGYGWYRGGL